MSLFAVPMDARTCHFHRTVGYLENGCRKDPNFKSMMMVMMMRWWGWWRWCWWWDTAKGLLREETHKACEFTWGGAWNWTFRAERRYPDPKREHPTMSMVAHHLVHFNSHLEVYIVRHTHRAGEKKTRSVLAQTPMSLFAVPMDARTCHFHRTVGYLENGCRKIRLSSRMMMVMRRRMMMMMMLMMMMVMMTRHCEGAAAWRDSPGIWREFPLRGGAGSLSPGRSGIRGPARPFASQSKTQGSPLGGYLSWQDNIFKIYYRQTRRAVSTQYFTSTRQ